MNVDNFYLRKEDLPAWFEYPESYSKIVNLELVNLDPWHILSGDLLRLKYEGINQRYPKLSLVPFARRFDNDDVACWEKNNMDKIVIIHDYSSDGWEIVREYEDFWCWFRAAVEDMIEFE